MRQITFSRTTIVAALLLFMCSVLPAQNKRHHGSADGSLKTALLMEQRGQFIEASSLLDKFFDDNARKLSPEEKNTVLFEIERMRRIRIDYSLTADELFGQLEHAVKGVSRQEFQRWIAEKKFDTRMIDDTLRFVNTSRSNLFFRYPAIAARRVPPVDERAHYTFILNNCLSIEKAADSLHTPYVMPTDLDLKMAVNVDSGTVKPGETVRAWLPIPRQFPYQKDFELLSSSSKPISIAPPDSPIRSCYMEQPAHNNGGDDFSIEYKYRTFAVHFDLDPRQIEGYDKSEEIYRTFTSQAPNIVFTDKIKRLSHEIVGKETNPLIKARLIYDWVARNIVYSFAREYSTIRNISDYCLTKRYGDCGQEAMLFITLCRYNGIPARWQSGWFFLPGGKDIHDWTQIYLRPYGWVPVDPYMGILATHYMSDLTPAERNVVRDFYFGGLDQYRMSANSENNQVLSPAKKYFRSDNVDFQRGEVETDSANIYFNKFDYNLQIEKIKSDNN